MRYSIYANTIQDSKTAGSINLLEIVQRLNIYESEALKLEETDKLRAIEIDQFQARFDYLEGCNKHLENENIYLKKELRK